MLNGATEKVVQSFALIPKFMVYSKVYKVASGLGYLLGWGGSSVS